MELNGRIAVVTGASQGLGVSIATQLVHQKAKVVLVARSTDLLAKVKRDLDALLGTGNETQIFTCDVSNTDDVTDLAQFIGNTFGRLDILVNNASVFGPIGKLVDVEWEGWLETFNVNLLGTVFVCRALTPLIIRSSRGKIINISGGGAAQPYPSLCAYATSKAAIIKFTEEFAEEMREYNVDVNSVAPGPLNTRFVDVMLAAGQEKLGKSLYEAIVKIRESGGTPFGLSANLCCYLASNKSDGITGKQISARYDNWSEFHEYIDVLDKSAALTTRRLDRATLDRLNSEMADVSLSSLEKNMPI